MQYNSFFSIDIAERNKLFNLVTWFYTTVAFCGIVVRVLGYRSRGPGSIPGATIFSEK
jgi:hypothetical protein